MALKFFNPAALLASPNVAVKPPPPNQDNFWIGEALNSINAMVKKKRDIDSLESETNAYADYLEEKSPDAANLLRTKAKSYSMEFTDTGAERSDLLKNAISLARLEQSDRKLELSNSQTRVDNLYGVKLTAANRNLDSAIRLRSDRQTEIDRAYKADMDAAQEVADAGGTPVIPVKGINTEDARVDAAQREVDTIQASTPNSALKSRIGPLEPPMPHINDPNDPVYGGPESPLLPGGEGADSTYGNPESNAATSDRLLNPGDELPSDGLVLPPKPSSAEAPAQSKPIQLADDRPSTDLSVPVRQGSGVNLSAEQPASSLHPLVIKSTAVRANNARRKEILKDSILSDVAGLNEKAERVANPESLKRINSEAAKAIKEIDQLPNVGSPEWIANANLIARRVSDAINSVIINTSTQEEKEKNIAEREEVQMRIKDGNGQVKTYIKQKVGGEYKYLEKMPDGRLKDIPSADAAMLEVVSVTSRTTAGPTTTDVISSKPSEIPLVRSRIIEYHKSP